MILTLPRLLLWTLWIFCGLVLATALLSIFFVVGYIVGFPLGFSGAFLATWAVLLGRILLLFPFPTCKDGKCRGLKGYVWEKGTVYGWERGGLYRYRCRCAREYVRKGRKFMEVGSDGVTLPHKKLAGFREWVDDVNNE